MLHARPLRKVLGFRQRSCAHVCFYHAIPTQRSPTAVLIGPGGDERRESSKVQAIAQSIRPSTQYESHYQAGIPIEPGEIHLWWLDSTEVQSPQLQTQYLNLLSTAEREYVTNGSNERVQKERLLARTLVRTVLARYCRGGLVPKSLKFESNSAGKPFVVSKESYDANGGGQLHFNLTHTERMLGLAVTRGALVGLDVEDSSRLTKSSPLRLAERRFAPREYSVLKGFENAKEQASLFIRMWTLKEAYVKAKGCGIAASPGLRSFAFELLLTSKVPKYQPKLDFEPSRHSNGAQKPPAPQQSAGKENVDPNHSQQPSSVGYAYQSSSATEHDGPTNREVLREMQAQHETREPSGSVPVSHYRAASDVSGSGREGAWVKSLPSFWDFRDRMPFFVQFEPSPDDRRGWCVWLMELQGGHTAALLLETEKPCSPEDRVRMITALKLRAFKTVPLQYEKAVPQGQYCRVIGFGISE